MTLTPALRERLEAVGALADADIDLAETALALAGIERPRVSLAPYYRHLDRLAHEVGAYMVGGPDKLEMRIEALVQVLAKRYGYAGTEEAFEDPDSANLTRVIDNRCGLPVALGILYLHAAQALGWPATGVDFPARFFVRLDCKGRRAILDPFDGGRQLTPRDLRAFFKAVAGNQAELTPEHYRSVGNREVLLRLQNNVKVRHLRAGHMAAALETVQTMLLLAPDKAPLWREAGLLNMRLDNVQAAVVSLEEYLNRSTSDPARYRASVLLQELRGRLN